MTELDRLFPVSTFDAALIAPEDRFERWNARTSTSFELLLPPSVQPHELRSSTRMWNLGPHVMIDGHYSPMTSRRPRHLAVADQFDHFMLRMAIDRPGGRCDADGHRFVLAQREAVLFDMQLPSTYESPGGRAMTILLPRSDVEASLPGRRNLHGAVPRGPCGRLLADHLVSLSSALPELTAQEARGAAQATVALLAASLMSTAATLEWVRPEIETALLTRICQFIRRNLSDPELSVTMVCSSFKISRATLYRLFEPIGGVAQFVKEQRLKRAHADIMANAGKQLRLSSLAEDIGFKDAAHFSRLFKQHFGYSPSEAVTKLPSQSAGGMIASDAATYFATVRALQR
jgi:AraC-like DNA-binding protein